MRTGIDKIEFSSSKKVLKEVIKEIVEKYGVKDLVFLENCRVRPWARVLLNGRSQEFSGGMDVLLKDGDVIALIYSFPYHENV